MVVAELRQLGSAIAEAYIVDKVKKDYAMSWGSLRQNPYNSASRTSRELSCWNPVLKSADSDMLYNKAATEARAQDLARNNGFIKGAIQNAKDRVVGSHFRLQLRPRYRALGYESGELDAWVSIIEQEFQSWAEDPDCFVDARRQMTFTQLIRECIGSNLIHGEYFLSREWKPTQRSKFSTCFLSVEPERIENPPQYSFDDNIRGGIKLDSYGEAVGYYVLTKHRNDLITSKLSNTYQYQPKFNDFGWLNFIHVFERERANQTRGFSPIASVIQKLKMLDRYEDTELEASIMAATYAMVLKSDVGPSALDALQGENPEETALYQYQQGRMAFNQNSKLSFDGVTVPQLFPNEELQLLSPNHPNGNSNEFKLGMNLHMARGVGTSYEEFTGDYSRTTYSSARVSMQVADNHIKATREGVASRLASQIFRLWLDEGITRGILPLPPRMDVSTYFSTRSQIAYCDWLGAGRIIIDEVKHQNATKIALSNGTTTLSQACAEAGLDWEDVLSQRAVEQARLKELGLVFEQIDIVDTASESQ